MRNPKKSIKALALSLRNPDGTIDIERLVTETVHLSSQQKEQLLKQLVRDPDEMRKIVRVLYDLAVRSKKSEE